MRCQRQAERERRDLEIAERQADFAKRQDEVDAENERLRQNIKALQCILATGLSEFNSRLQELKTTCVEDEPSSLSLCDYFEFVLQNSGYPNGFPQTTHAAFVKESAQLVIDYELPTIDVVPHVERYRFVKTDGEVTQTIRSAKARSAIYVDLIAQTVLRSLYEVYHFDIGQQVQTVVLNAHVSTVDRGTGKPIRPCLITVRATRDEFLDLDLSRVDPRACLKQLKAAVSVQPDELVAVRPIVHFDMVDPRFIKEEDVLSTMDQRPNLMELSPGEFESLITNLFSKMGLETKLTQPFRDGGVDCVAYDQRPILGGKVVIQAKRYKDTVGVSSVRDLFGTMHNEGASKGILVTTSGYGKAAYSFASNKPIELIAGSNLLYLLQEHANVDAKIEVPPDWVDPAIE
jgi:restriction system protein